MHGLWLVEMINRCAVFLLAFLHFNQPIALQHEPADSRLLIEMFSIMPLEDQEELELFIANLVEQDQFGYVLFSEKPIALSGGFVKTPSDNVLAGVDTGCLCLKRWELWKSYFEGMTFTNFLIIEENCASLPDIRFIFLINKTLFVRTVKEHIKRFQDITGRSIDPRKLLSDIEQRKTTLQQAISYDEELLGILLGFGGHNASLYAKRRKLEGPPLIPLALENKPSIGFNSVEEEVASLYERLKSPYDEDFGVYLIDPVVFVTDKSHPETEMLCRKYLKARANLSRLYINKSFLEVSLKQLISQPFVVGDACGD